MRPPVSAEEWQAYHAIRRRVLFEGRGRFGVYQEEHPDEFAPGNYPHLLFGKSVPIGAIRIDLPPKSDEAIFRRVAILEEHQRQGHGRRLMEAAEGFAVAHGRRNFVANVDRSAIPFYLKLGYRLDPGGYTESAECPRMVKSSVAPS